MHTPRKPRRQAENASPNAAHPDAAHPAPPGNPKSPPPLFPMPPPFCPAAYLASLRELGPYSLATRCLLEDTVPDCPRLMRQSGLLAAGARVLRYTFDGTQKNIMLHALLEQAGKAGHAGRLDRAPCDEHLTTGEKARAALRHVKNYVVLLPLRLPRGTTHADLTDTSKCAMLTAGLTGHLVVIEYACTTDPSDNVLFATGVTTDRAYVNGSGRDHDLRLRVFDDDPLAGDDKQPLLLPVHVLDCFDTVVTWNDVIDATVAVDPGADTGVLKRAYSLLSAAASLEARLSPELKVFLAGSGGGADAWLTESRWRGLCHVATVLGGETLRIVTHMATSSLSPALTCATARVAASKKVSVGAVLGAAIQQARQKRFRK